MPFIGLDGLLGVRCSHETVVRYRLRHCLIKCLGIEIRTVGLQQHTLVDGHLIVATLVQTEHTLVHRSVIDFQLLTIGHAKLGSICLTAVSSPIFVCRVVDGSANHLVGRTWNRIFVCSELLSEGLRAVCCVVVYLHAELARCHIIFCYLCHAIYCASKRMDKVAVGQSGMIASIIDGDIAVFVRHGKVGRNIGVADVDCSIVFTNDTAASIG